MIQKAVVFFKDVQNELSQVSWSTPQELLGSTRIVLVTVALLSVVIWFFDSVCALMMSWMLR